MGTASMERVGCLPSNLGEDEQSAELLEEFVLMTESDQAFWLCRIIHEVRRYDWFELEAAR